VLLSRGGHTSVGADRGDEGFDACCRDVVEGHTSHGGLASIEVVNEGVGALWGCWLLFEHDAVCVVKGGTEAGFWEATHPPCCLLELDGQVDNAVLHASALVV